MHMLSWLSSKFSGLFQEMHLPCIQVCQYMSLTFDEFISAECFISVPLLFLTCLIDERTLVFIVVVLLVKTCSVFLILSLKISATVVLFFLISFCHWKLVWLLLFISYMLSSSLPISTASQLRCSRNHDVFLTIVEYHGFLLTWCSILCLKESKLPAQNLYAIGGVVQDI